MIPFLGVFSISLCFLSLGFKLNVKENYMASLRILENMSELFMVGANSPCRRAFPSKERVIIHLIGSFNAEISIPTQKCTAMIGHV